MLQICPILLVLLCPPNIDAASTERKAKCGKTTVRSMVPFEYVSHTDKHPRTIAIAAKGHFGAGNFATVSDAFTGNSEQLAKNKCVAVKFMDSYFGHSLAVIDRMMALLPGQRGHLIETLDYGRSGDEIVLLMERGEQSLHERIYTERRNYPDFESIRPLLEQVVRPLGEMHKGTLTGRSLLHSFGFRSVATIS